MPDDPQIEIPFGMWDKLKRRIATQRTEFIPMDDDDTLFDEVRDHIRNGTQTAGSQKT